MKMKLSVAEGHLCNMGRMIEEMESKLRNSLDQVKFCLPILCLSRFDISGTLCPFQGTSFDHTNDWNYAMVVPLIGIFWENKRDGLHLAATLRSGAYEIARQVTTDYTEPELAQRTGGQL